MRWLMRESHELTLAAAELLHSYLLHASPVACREALLQGLG
jgi:hypothetical protein